MPDRTAPQWARLVDGMWLPAPWGGHPALDFCNTLAGWQGPVQHDYLRDYDYLRLFVREADLLENATIAAACSEGSEAELSRARDLRAAAYSILIGAGDSSSRTTVSTAVEEAAAAARFLLEPPGARWTLPPQLGVRLPFLAIARSLGELLESDDAGSVSACPGDGCGWLFLDRLGRRRWCSMAVCGNRSKARRHAERTATRPRSGQ